MNVFSVVVFVFYAVAFLCGLANAAAPRWCWKTFESWKATKEPSKAYFLTKRIAGIVLMVVAAAAAVLPTIMAHLHP